MEKKFPNYLFKLAISISIISVILFASSGVVLAQEAEAPEVADVPTAQEETPSNQVDTPDEQPVEESTMSEEPVPEEKLENPVVEEEPVVDERQEEPIAEQELAPIKNEKDEPFTGWYDPTEPTGDSCLNKCNAACKCRWAHGGGGPVMQMLYHFGYNSPYGDMDGFGLWLGGRGYGYVLDDHLRLGGMGFGGMMSSNVGLKTDLDPSLVVDQDYANSEERSIGAGYGGFTAEYVFRLLDGKIEIPMGLLFGFGGGGYESQLKKVQSIGADVVGTESGTFLAVQPMVSVDVNALRFLRIGFSGTVLWAPVVQGDLDDLSGAGAMVSLMFGNFTNEPLDWE